MERRRWKWIGLLLFVLLAAVFGAGVRYGQFLLFRDEGAYLQAEIERRGIPLALNAFPTEEEEAAAETASGAAADETAAKEETAAAAVDETAAKEETAKAPAVQEETKTLTAGDRIGLNSADAAALELLPGIGPKKAAAIIAYREENGGFASIDEVLEVKGIGPAIFGQIEPYLTLE